VDPRGPGKRVIRGSGCERVWALGVKMKSVDEKKAVMWTGLLWKGKGRKKGVKRRV